ncbi:MAG: replication/maintenance protein RepL [Crocosphaera sp.]
MKTTRIKAEVDRNNRVVGYIDERTGQEYGFPVIFGRKRNPYSKGWIMNSQDALDILAEDKDIKGVTYRVLFKVCARVDFENWVHLPIKEIADELNIDKSQVSRNIKLLVEKGVLIKSKKIGRSYGYRLNPDFGWKGKVKNLDDYRKQKEDEERHQKNREIYEKNLELVGLSKKDQLIMAIKKGEIDIEKYYQLMTKDQETNDDQR